jgi:Asp-tRNA(Asn)/Glu-tRNA(Gln) amidotransferase A subunit family amidase
MATAAAVKTSARLNELSAAEIARGIAAKKFTCEAVVRDCLDRIAAREPAVHAWANIDPDYALMQARALDRMPSSKGPLHGVPLGVKDIINTEHYPTEMGSPIYKGNRSFGDAACVALARMAGVVIMGKTVTAEFAGMHPGPTANPHNPAHTPGGSSSGSGAAVADFHIPAAYGTQTGGSVLRPASYCGCIGTKPTFNLINRQGICFAAETLDTIGLLTRTVDDADLIVSVLVNKTPAYIRLDSPPRIGLCRTPLWDTAEEPTRHAVEDAAKRLAAAGASVKEIVLPKEFEQLYYTARETINNYERSKSMAADWQHHPDKISKVLGDRIKKGFAMKHEEYIAALQLAERCRTNIGAAFEGIDAILSPCVNGEPPKGLNHAGEPGFQQFWTVLNGPTMSLPTHKGPQGLPVGIQLVAARYRDDHLFACARWVMDRLTK